MQPARREAERAPYLLVAMCPSAAHVEGSRQVHRVGAGEAAGGLDLATLHRVGAVEPGLDVHW